MNRLSILQAVACAGLVFLLSGCEGNVKAKEGAPRGTGPYGIATTPDGQVFFASLAGNYLGQIDLETGGVTVLEPPVPRQGARRVWSDRHGALWITGWTSGDLFRYDSKAKSWAHWHLPGDGPQPYAVYVDETDAVWVSDWGANGSAKKRSRPGAPNHGRRGAVNHTIRPWRSRRR